MRSGQGCPFPSSWFWCFLEADKGGLLTSTVSSGNFVVLGLCWWEWAATIVFQAPIWWNSNVMCSTLVFFFMRSQGFFHRKFCFDWFFLIFWEAWCWWTWSWRYFGIASTWLCKRTLIQLHLLRSISALDGTKKGSRCAINTPFVSP